MDHSWVKATLQEVRDDVKAIHKSVSALEIASARQNVSLETHMRRTEAAEAGIELLRNEIRPLKTRAAVESALLRGLSVAAAAGGSIVGILKLIGRV